MCFGNVEFIAFAITRSYGDRYVTVSLFDGHFTVRG